MNEQEWTVEYLQPSIERRCLGGDNVEIYQTEEWVPARDFVGVSPGGVKIRTLEYCVKWYREWFDDGRIYRMVRKTPPCFRIRNVHTGETIPCDVL